MKILSRVSLLACGMVLAGCVSPPSAPSVMVLPGSNKSYEQFNRDDTICRSDAQNRVNGGTQAAANNAAGTAVAGTVIGAAAGALIGAASGHAGEGAAIGAGSGLLVGSSMGSNAGQRSSGNLQQQYDTAYQECMYARGDKVPVNYGSQQFAEPQVPPDYYPAQDSDVPPDYVPR